MIQPLRRAHRLTFAILAFVLPATLLVGLGARRSQSVQTRMASDLPSSAYMIRRSGRLWQKHAIVTEFFGDSHDTQQFYVILQPQQPLNEPDPLLYWSSSAFNGDALPDDARLIGALDSKVLSFQVAGARAGRMFIYSGAHRAIVDTTLVEKLP